MEWSKEGWKTDKTHYKIPLCCQIQRSIQDHLSSWLMKGAASQSSTRMHACLQTCMCTHTLILLAFTKQPYAHFLHIRLMEIILCSCLASMCLCAHLSIIATLAHANADTHTHAQKPFPRPQQKEWRREGTFDCTESQPRPLMRGK